MSRTNSLSGSMAFDPKQVERPSPAICQPRKIMRNAGLCARALLSQGAYWGVSLM
jgi:hypothetical protein